MRRFDTATGAEMWVSDYRTSGKYEWSVILGHDQVGRPIVVKDGVAENFTDAIKIASEIYDELVEV